MEEGGARFTFADLDATHRARYGWTSQQDLTTSVQLGCTACHQLDGDESPRGLAPSVRGSAVPRTAGAYMLPVTYATHCCACHTLSFDPNVPGRQVRHGLSPGSVIDDLREFYAAQAAKADPALLRRTVTSRPIPGQAPLTDQRIDQAIADKVLTAAKLLFGAGVDEAVRKRQHLPVGRRGCVECHNLTSSAAPLITTDALASLDIEPVFMTPVWFEHARFDHTAHRAECAGCHVGVSESKENGGGLLPGIATCANVTRRIGAGRGACRGSEYGVHGVPPVSQRRSPGAGGWSQGAAGRDGTVDRAVLDRRSTRTGSVRHEARETVPTACRGNVRRANE